MHKVHFHLSSVEENSPAISEGGSKSFSHRALSTAIFCMRQETKANWAKSNGGR